MPLKLQRVLRFIPGVNLVSFVAWIILAIRKKMKPTYFIKTVVLILALIFFAIMIERGLATFSANVIFKTVLFYLGIVLYTYIFAFISVSEQENLINGKRTFKGSVCVQLTHHNRRINVFRKIDTDIRGFLSMVNYLSNTVIFILFGKSSELSNYSIGINTIRKFSCLNTVFFAKIF